MAVRRKLWIELPQRSISSTALSHSDGSSRRRCAWSGWSIRASIEWLIRFRVVSLPATIERDEEQVELDVVEALAVDLGLHERGHDVVARVAAAVGGHRVAQRVDLDRRPARVRRELLVVGIVARADEVVGQLEHPGPLLGLEADHLADHLHRDLGGDLLDELALAPLAHVVDDDGSARRSISSTSVAIIRGVNALRHQAAVAVVLGRVHVEDREAQLGQRLLVLRRDERAAELGGERLAVVAHRAHVGVLGDAPRSRGRPARGASSTGASRRSRSNWSCGHAACPRCRPAGRCRRGRLRSCVMRVRLLLVSAGDDAPEGGDRRGRRSMASGSTRRIISRPSSTPMTAGPSVGGARRRRPAHSARPRRRRPTRPR